MIDLTDDEIGVLNKLLDKKCKQYEWVLLNCNPKNASMLGNNVALLRSIIMKLQGGV